jgi:hypothetical protein
MNPIRSIAFTQRGDEYSAIVLSSDFTGWELIYDDMVGQITEAYSVNAQGSRPEHTVVSINDVPPLLLIKVKKFIKLNYGNLVLTQHTHGRGIIKLPRLLSLLTSLRKEVLIV